MYTVHCVYCTVYIHSSGFFYTIKEYKDIYQTCIKSNKHLKGAILKKWHVILNLLFSRYYGNYEQCNFYRILTRVWTIG
jgi:hypothetical protein